MSELEFGLYDAAPVELYEFLSGSTAYRYTSSDQPVAFGGHTYESRAIARQELQLNQEASSGSLELSLPRLDPLVALFIGYLPPTTVTLTVWRLQRQDLQGLVIFAGAVSSAAFEGSLATLKCVSLENTLARSVPGMCYQSQCNLVLYGTRCGASATSFRAIGQVSQISGTLIMVSNCDQPANWWQWGWVQNALGERRSIIQSVGTILFLNAPFSALTVGDTVSVYAGCAHTESDCLNKFNRLEAFFGFSHMPASNPFTGGV